MDEGGGPGRGAKGGIAHLRESRGRCEGPEGLRGQNGRRGEDGVREMRGDGSGSDGIQSGGEG